MKIIFAVLLVSLCYVHADLTPEQLEKLQTMMQECKEQTKVTDEDVALLMQHKVPESQAGKCFSACIKKKLGVLDADNKVDMERVKKLMEHVKEKDETKYNGLMKVFETCAAEVPGGSDECEVAGKLTECALRELKANNIEFSILNIFKKQ